MNLLLVFVEIFLSPAQQVTQSADTLTDEGLPHIDIVIFPISRLRPVRLLFFSETLFLFYWTIVTFLSG